MKARYNKPNNLPAVRFILKTTLVVLHKHFGFGEKRLTDFLTEWAEIVNEIKNQSDINTEMLVIDNLLDKVFVENPVLDTLGKEYLKNNKGDRI